MKYPYVTIHKFPDSQYCMECKHGQFAELANNECSVYICNIASLVPSDKCSVPKDNKE